MTTALTESILAEADQVIVVDLPPNPEVELHNLVAQVKSLNAEISGLMHVVLYDWETKMRTDEYKAANRLGDTLSQLLFEVKRYISEEITKENLFEKIESALVYYKKNVILQPERLAQKEKSYRLDQIAATFVQNLLADLQTLTSTDDIKARLVAAGVDPVFLAELAPDELNAYVNQIAESTAAAHKGMEFATEEGDRLLNQEWKIELIYSPILIRFQEIVTAILQSQQNELDIRALLYSIYIPADPLNIHTAWYRNPGLFNRYYYDNEWLPAIRDTLMQDSNSHPQVG